ncbi:MAG: hypothetical protein HY293_17560 [Planctomycetes bacterium]|nr:hypothetical protein [Planctomycetota bacterium]
MPSLGLAELCEMLWDMVRYANYDPKSAYNYAAGRWSETQTQFDFPLDPRNLRDRMTKTVGDNVIKFSDPTAGKGMGSAAAPLREAPPIVKPPEEDILIITDDAPARPSPQFRPQPRPRAADDDILIIE